MPRPLPRDRWLANAAERFATRDAWRQAHPTATWAELEAAIDGELSQLRARILGETAMSSDATGLGRSTACPDCGEPLQGAGTRHWQLRAEQDRTIALERTYACCPHCGSGLSPLDEELGLLTGALTPTLQGHPARLGSQFSFATAARELGRLKGARVSGATVRRRTEADRALLAAWEATEATRALAEAPPPPPGPPLQQVCVDGTMVGLQDGSWREVRTLAIGTVVPGPAVGTVAYSDVSAFSRLADAITFTTLAAGETHRRGVERA